MKKLGLLALAALFSIGAWAAPGDEPSLGARAGLDINSLTGPGFKNAVGFELGAVYNMPLIISGIQGLYLEPGLYIYKGRWGVNKKDWAVQEGVTQLDRVKSAYFSTWGLRIPVMCGWRYNVDNEWRVMGFTGPVVSVGLKNRFHLNGNTDGGDAKLSWNAYGDEGWVHRADLAWRIGIGAEWQNWHFDISGDIGLTHMMHDVDYNNHLNRLAFTVGYNFTL